MKIETKVLLASTVGLVAVIGLAVFRKLINTQAISGCYYDEFHTQFTRPDRNEDSQHGVEYLSVR